MSDKAENAFNNKEWIQLRKLARQYFKQSLSREQVFRLIYSEMYEKEVPMSTVVFHFHCVDQVPNYQWWHEDIYYKERILIGIISEEFERLRSVIAVLPNGKQRKMFAFLDERYALCFNYCEKEMNLLLIDLFHCQQQRIQLIGKLPVFVDNSKHSVVIVDSKYLLLTENSHCKTNSDIHLLKLDLFNFTCALVESKGVKNQFIQIVFEVSNRHNFVIWTRSDFVDYFQSGSICGGQLQIGEEVVCSNKQSFCPQLVGNKLQIMTTENNKYKEEELIECSQILLTSNAEKSTFKKQFNVKMEKHVNDLENTAHFQYVSPSFGYIFPVCRSGMSSFSVYALDLIEQKLEFVKSFAYFDADILAVHINKDVATMCIFNRLTNELLIHRFMLKEPDLLQNLSYFAARKCVGNRSNNELMPILPLTLRSFFHFY